MDCGQRCCPVLFASPRRIRFEALLTGTNLYHIQRLRPRTPYMAMPPETVS
ncbi:uncharacterized protein SETTUDRAFT_47635 [Exserohilum turcica Et28A]|uniref:Uncharacterized protein n=1 Tax=Exserohilum turcicum (strain 28A) TaxID=671987 RepID=R0IMJ2_EXST2|nr:uncharacterized protein SETTUDRAFT_47635 [Exserohilum turcica Et28A]EOA86011.1 hypothetical protein SETTUDRAFT_47635 [Exserohilum turcica Et28A]